MKVIAIDMNNQHTQSVWEFGDLIDQVIKSVVLLEPVPLKNILAVIRIIPTYSYTCERAYKYTRTDTHLGQKHRIVT